jgi:hypothetical protein
VPLTDKSFDSVVRKLKMETRAGKHRFVWFVHEGKAILFTLRSHGRGDLGRVEHTIRQQLKVSSSQMRDLVNCPMSREAYIQHLRTKDLIRTG